jgi:rhodanese-related sulfurtransferase
MQHILCALSLDNRDPVRGDSFACKVSCGSDSPECAQVREVSRKRDMGGRMRKVRRTIARGLPLGVLGVAIAFGQGLAAPSHAETALLRTENEVARRWPDVIHVPAEQLAKMMMEGKIALFDVRELQEYQVSHIQGAQRINPAIGRDEFLQRHAGEIPGKVVVFYCAVGQRSSRLADRVGEGLKARGAIEVYNLKGGIFAWHNEAYPLVDGIGPTDFVHPYSQAWGRVLRRQDFLRTTPRH